MTQPPSPPPPPPVGGPGREPRDGGYFPQVPENRPSKGLLAAWLSALAACLGLLAWLLFAQTDLGLWEQGWREARGLYGRVAREISQLVGRDEPAPPKVAETKPEDAPGPGDRAVPAGLDQRQARAGAALDRAVAQLKKNPGDAVLTERAQAAALELLQVAGLWSRAGRTDRARRALGLLESVLGGRSRSLGLAGKMRVSNLSHRWLPQKSGRVLLVSGRVENLGPGSRRVLALRGVLLDKNRAPLARAYALAGRPLPSPFSASKALAALLRPPQEGERFKPGAKVLFHLLFINPPPQARRFVVYPFLAR